MTWPSTSLSEEKSITTCRRQDSEDSSEEKKYALLQHRWKFHQFFYNNRSTQLANIFKFESLTYVVEFEDSTPLIRKPDNENNSGLVHPSPILTIYLT
jgi:hypothetical protein